MERFNVKCPDRLPEFCSLTPGERESLLAGGKYKGFLVTQYTAQDEYAEHVVNRYFDKRGWRVLFAIREPGTPTKFCKICRLALAADFGIAFLTPLNFNVFQEIGLLQGLKKPVLPIYNRKSLQSELQLHGLAKMPFNIDDKTCLTYETETELEDKLTTEMFFIEERIELLTGLQSDQRAIIRRSLEKLTEDAMRTLKVLVCFPWTKLGGDRVQGQIKPEDWCKKHSLTLDSLHVLEAEGFLIYQLEPPKAGHSGQSDYHLVPPDLVPHLAKLLWQPPYAAVSIF